MPGPEAGRDIKVYSAGPPERRHDRPLSPDPDQKVIGERPALIAPMFVVSAVEGWGDVSLSGKVTATKHPKL
ncbi:MAG TPA: hypothetical protein VNA13_04965 [Xanthomonadales bacterium]|nr:hypothetical protein [Xanthomonadales bacterium]